ncbi:SGNH/GDSL hydrolase family protein [Singulisphaera sp. PoT]|uniref:SGNH/GDSL hydrolase family protein n=1 Tax=Singulisphaera sp. PoT TaxID=3411797 RepID=UPI003BF5B252
MNLRRSVSLGALAFALCQSSAIAQPAGRVTPPVSLKERLPELHLLEGPWTGSTVHGETLLFIAGGKKGPSARLLYDVEKILSVRAANRSQEFQRGRDFEVSPDGSGLVLPAGSRIRFIGEAELFPAKGALMSIASRAGHPEASVMFDNAHYFHDLQVEVTYVPKAPKWEAYRPEFAAETLVRTIGKLKKKQPVTIAVSGDSISEGYNASEFTKTTPFQPPYPTLVAAQLEATYGGKVTLHNFAVGGWSSKNGADDVQRVIKAKPDLAIIAYGMNDVGAKNPNAYRANIETMIRKIHEANAETEIILVATMTGNPDWVATPAEMFPVYGDVLASFEGPGIALADLTSVWQRFMVRKRHVDMTGNGVNHPDDFGHRVYAQTILGLLVDPALMPAARP